MENVIINIKAKWDKFSKSEKKYAQFIFQNPIYASKLTTREAAKKCNVSAPTIVRFSKMLGFSTYTDFKIALALSTREAADLGAINESDGFWGIYGKLLGELETQTVQLKECISDNSFEAFAKKASKENFENNDAVMVYELCEYKTPLEEGKRFYLITDNSASKLIKNAEATFVVPENLSELTVFALKKTVEIRMKNFGKQHKLR